MNSSLRERVSSWIESDPDEDDQATLLALLEGDDEAELSRRFAAPLTFGTAGLRGPEMAGPAGMNRATVRRATQGVLAWLDELGLELADGVVVGRDARHGSERFNDEVIAVLLGAVAGIMITASHNPSQDNGYKLYARDGAQIVPPDDEIVERHARSAGTATLAERSVASHYFVARTLIEEYCAQLVVRFHAPGASDLRITYTPLHGVGGALMMGLFTDAGYDHVTTVARQFEPDGSFPTLPFPNPEEPGSLDLAKATANDVDATLIIANDPDADRLGAAVREDGGWRELRGDEIGRLLASSLLADIAKRGEVVATTIVSSTMLAAMAKDAGVRCVTTLTGFKWIARAARPDVLGFGYEEALGFAVDSRVADKDGLSAALALCALADALARRGQTLLDRLDELEERFGVHATYQLSVRAEGPGTLDSIRRVVDQLRAEPPASLGQFAVSDVVDLIRGWRGLAPTEGVLLELGSLARVIVRPSGTEAKVKAYFEVTPPRTGTLAEQRAVAARVSDELLENVGALLRF